MFYFELKCKHKQIKLNIPIAQIANCLFPTIFDSSACISGLHKFFFSVYLRMSKLRKFDRC